MSSLSSASSTALAVLFVAAALLFLRLLVLLLSVVRADLGLAASWNVAIAGVDGLLARPLFVTVAAVMVWGTGGGSIGVSGSSGFGVSFFCFATGMLGLTLVSVGSGSFFMASGAGGADASLGTGFASAAGFGVLTGGTISGVGGGTPLGLADADDGGRDCFPPSAFTCVVLCLAREAVGALGAGGTGVEDGAGEPRGNGGSGKVARTGDDVTDGDMAATPFLLLSGTSVNVSTPRF